MIRNEYFAASFDPRTGTISVHRSDGTPFSRGGIVCANTDRQTVDRVTGPRAFRRHVRVPRSAGSGRRMASCRGPAEAARLARRSRRCTTSGRWSRSRHTAPTSRRATSSSRASSRSASSRAKGARSACRASRRASRTARCTTKRAGSTLSPPIRRRAASARQGRAARERIDRAAHPTVASWWNIGLFSGYDREAVVLGYLENTRALGLVLASGRRERNRVLERIGLCAADHAAPGKRSARTASC